MMQIKLTPAQADIVQARNLHGVLTNSTLECDNLDLLVQQLEAAVAEVLTWEYTPAAAREIFATRYLLTKVQKFAATPQPVVTPIEVGATVYIIGDREQEFRVVQFNADGSAGLWGGTVQYASFRDIPVALLTTVRPKSMLTPRHKPVLK
jgi:hypothetical protein